MRSGVFDGQKNELLGHVPRSGKLRFNKPHTIEQPQRSGRHPPFS
jgi:hypothetical protein